MNAKMTALASNLHAALIKAGAPESALDLNISNGYARVIVKFQNGIWLIFDANPADANPADADGGVPDNTFTATRRRPTPYGGSHVGTGGALTAAQALSRARQYSRYSPFASAAA